MDTYLTRAQALELEIAALEQDLKAVQDGPQRNSLWARLASARKSLDWYRARIPRRITALAVNVHEDITTHERA